MDINGGLCGDQRRLSQGPQCHQEKLCNGGNGGTNICPNSHVPLQGSLKERETKPSCSVLEPFLPQEGPLPPFSQLSLLHPYKIGRPHRGLHPLAQPSWKGAVSLSGMDRREEAGAMNKLKS